jgi:hypothetical protein
MLAYFLQIETATLSPMPTMTPLQTAAAKPTIPTTTPMAVTTTTTTPMWTILPLQDWMMKVTKMWKPKNVEADDGDIPNVEVPYDKNMAVKNMRVLHDDNIEAEDTQSKLKIPKTPK